MRRAWTGAVTGAAVIWLVCGPPAEAGTGFVEEAKLLASDGAAGDFFGASVAVFGDRVAVGAADDNDNGTQSGSVYVFDWDGSQWVETAKLLPSDGEAFDLFGGLVAISGDRVAAGEGRVQGADRPVYVFDRDGSQWVETAKLLPSDGGGLQGFGGRFELSGNRIVVGSQSDNDNGPLSGSAYVYDWDGSQWVETKLLPSDGAASEQFGISVAVSGDRVVVGDYRYRDEEADSGAAYVFDWDGAQWVETKLLASDRERGDQFGISVAVSGDRVVVGADEDDDNGEDSGSDYVFHWDGSQWVETKLLASDAAAFDHFGLEVAASGDRVVVRNNVDATKDVYVFDWDGSQWVETKLMASDAVPSDDFGTSVAVSDERIAVGAPEDSVDGTESGSAYVFRAISLGGATTGTRTSRTVCVNADTGETVEAVLLRAGWDCAGAGLGVSRGDRILQRVEGVVEEAVAGGTVFGVLPQLARCVNRTTGQGVVIPLDGEASWDCTAAGLVVQRGDRLEQQVTGRAE